MYENIISLDTKGNISSNVEAIFLSQDYKKYSNKLLESVWEMGYSHTLLTVPAFLRTTWQ